MLFLLLSLGLLTQSGEVVLDNAYVRVTRNGAPCASGEGVACGDRVLVALGPTELGGRNLERGDVVVFEQGTPYDPPAGGNYAEVNLKPDFPPVDSPSELIPPAKNTLLHDGDRFFVFEEKLATGDTRPRHSHSQRVVIVLNETRLQQWPDGAPELFKDQIPGTIKFNPPVIHVVKTIGDEPLRNIVIELRPSASESSSP